MYEPYRRGDCGEYRVVYRLDAKTETVYVLLVGKRNGGEVYRQLKKILS
jgi:mRNA interferase RelE/StbE